MSRKPVPESIRAKRYLYDDFLIDVPVTVITIEPTIPEHLFVNGFPLSQETDSPFLASDPVTGFVVFGWSPYGLLCHSKRDYRRVQRRPNPRSELYGFGQCHYFRFSSLNASGRIESPTTFRKG